ncbi:MAG TPA: tyrosine-protein phosphatase, partial [Baekduia sp.]|nr:tyrosine-protein phosphatase [Baekduia sp.]
QFGTPIYYRPHLERFPERTAAVLAAIANATPGGVAFHCGGGRDRAGQITMVLLALLGVAPRDIAADYMLSYERLPARYAARGEPDQGPLLKAFLADRGTTASDIIIDTLESLGVEAQVRTGGLTDQDVITLRDRVLGPATGAAAGGGFIALRPCR